MLMVTAMVAAAAGPAVSMTDGLSEPEDGSSWASGGVLMSMTSGTWEPWFVARGLVWDLGPEGRPHEDGAQGGGGCSEPGKHCWKVSGGAGGWHQLGEVVAHRLVRRLRTGLVPSQPAPSHQACSHQPLLPPLPPFPLPDE